MSGLARGLDRELGLFGAILARRFGSAEVESILAATRAAFAEVAPRLEARARQAGPMAENLVITGWFLALRGALLPRGLSDEEIGDLCLAIVEERLRRRPRLVRALQARLARSRLVRVLLKRQAASTKAAPFAEGFVVDYLEGGAGRFDFGLDITRCGICHLLAAERASSFAPQMCRIDFVTSAANGLALERTGTIANGAPECDFRFRVVR